LRVGAALQLLPPGLSLKLLGQEFLDVLRPKFIRPALEVLEENRRQTVFAPVPVGQRDVAVVPERLVGLLQRLLKLVHVDAMPPGEGLVGVLTVRASPWWQNRQPVVRRYAVELRAARHAALALHHLVHRVEESVHLLFSQRAELLAHHDGL